MNCPILDGSKSILKGQKRLDKAIDRLGEDVVKRILGFSLYTLGYSYEWINKHIGMPEAGMKLIVGEIYDNGVERFIDKRKKDSYSINIKASPTKSIPSKVTLIENSNNEFFEFTSTGPISLNIRKDDHLSKKIISLLFLESNLLNQKEVSEILGCQRQAVHRNQMNLKSMGVKGLYDNRLGQKKDYKYSPDHKSKIIHEFFLAILENKLPSKINITKRLNEKSPDLYSQRSVADHLKKMGLTDNKEQMYIEIANHVNSMIDDFSYLGYHKSNIEHPGLNGFNNYIDLLKEVKQEMDLLQQVFGKNIFEIEREIEMFQSKLQPLMLESLLKEAPKEHLQCPDCHSLNIGIAGKKKVFSGKSTLNTSLGGSFSLNKQVYCPIKCNDCQREFDLIRDILKLPKNSTHTPLTQKKICSANRAGSYENAAKNLKELINLDINRNQVRNTSAQIGRYIDNEFKGLNDDIVSKLSLSAIVERHPLVEALRIDKKYLNSSRYLIVFAIDGGRMQLYNWIPPENEAGKAQKKLYWHENKVFRISIYDKSDLVDMPKNKNEIADKQKSYKSAKIIPGLTTYGATNRSWKETAPLIRSHLYMRGISLKDIQLCLSDGSEHIMRDIFAPLFPDSIHILDYYHKAEALHACIKIIGHQKPELEKKLKKHLWEGEVNKLIQELKDKQPEVGFPKSEEKRKSEDPKVKYDNFINHLGNNKSRMQYKEFREEKFPIGSGCIESAVKLFGKRIKGTEKQWNEEGGEAILHLYSFLLSEDNRWEKLWHYHQPWL